MAVAVAVVQATLQATDPLAHQLAGVEVGRPLLQPPAPAALELRVLLSLVTYLLSL
jgi:hypothetical protein